MSGNYKQKEKNSKVGKKGTFRLMFFGLFSVVIIVFILISISSVVVEIYIKYKEKAKLDDQLSQLREKEAELTVDVERMKDPEYVARYLREKFLYSKSGEYIIRIPE